MKVTPKTLFKAMGLGEPVPGQNELPSPATLLETKTGETVEVKKIFFDERDVTQSMVLPVTEARTGWRPLALYELPSVVAKCLKPRLAHGQSEGAGA
jgi:hypothetical protein